VQLTPKGGDIGFEISAGSLALPFVPALTLSDFGMKGTANRGGVVASEFDGRVFDGVISGTAKIRWGANWTVDGDVRARALRVAVFAPALVSEGKVEGRGAYSMSGSVPANLFESAKVQGDFKIEKGVLGSFDLTRALKTGGAQSTGSTAFSELAGQAVYDKGALQLRNGTTSIGSQTAPLAVGTVYRIGIHQKSGTGGDAILEGYLAVGDAPFGAPFAVTTTGPWTTLASKLQVGTTTSTALDGIFDDIKLDTGAMPVPNE